MKRAVMLITVADRTAAAGKVQELLTRSGCEIKTRLGLHSTGQSTCCSGGSSCGNDGLIFLELAGDPKADSSLAKQLNKVKGVKAKLVTL
jgi:hypothetical protein